MSDDAKILKLVPAKSLDFSDVPACLRTMAAAIENGDYGIKEARELHADKAIVRAVLVLRVSNQYPMVFSWGSLEHLAQAYQDLHAGAAAMMAMTHPERG